MRSGAGGERNSTNDVIPGRRSGPLKRVYVKYARKFQLSSAPISFSISSARKFQYIMCTCKFQYIMCTRRLQYSKCTGKLCQVHLHSSQHHSRRLYSLLCPPLSYRPHTSKPQTGISQLLSHWQHHCQNTLKADIFRHFGEVECIFVHLGGSRIDVVFMDVHKCVELSLCARGREVSEVTAFRKHTHRGG